MDKKKLKYWLLTSEYPPMYGGGISTYCRYTAELLSRNGHSVTVFVQDDSVRDFLETTSDEGVKVVRFNTNRSGLADALGLNARTSYEFAKIVEHYILSFGKPDIIEAQDYLGIACYLQQFQLALYEPFQNFPIVITLHSPAFLYLEYNHVDTYKYPDFWTCEMEKQSIVAADLLISPTRFLPDATSPYLDLSGVPLKIIPNPYRKQQSSAPGAAEISGETVLFYGKLSPQKGTFELLSYFKEIWDQGKNIVLQISGGTDIVYHPELMTMGDWVRLHYGSYIEKGLIRFSGRIPPERLGEELSKARVVVFPSIVDNLPYVVMEVMSHGKVILSSIQGGQAEMIEDGVDGFLFDHSKKGDFERQLLSILQLPAKELAAIADNAVRAVDRKYSEDLIYNTKIAAIYEVLDNWSPRTSYPFQYQEPPGQLDPPETNGLLSIIVPYFNMSAYIEETVASILSSTYPTMEVLIIDDGSREDEHRFLLDKFGRTKQVRIIRKDNEGLAAARNTGAGLAAGQYLAFLDADDTVAPTYYERAIQLFRRYDNVYFAGCWAKYFGKGTSTWVGFNPVPPYLLVHNTLNSSSLVYRKEAFLAAGRNDPKLIFGLEDYESVVSMVSNGYNGVALPEPLFHYRIRSGSMFRRMNKRKLLFSYKYIAEKHRKYYSKFAVQIINLLNANGPGYFYDNPTFEIDVRSRSEQTRLLQKFKSLIKKNDLMKSVALKIMKIKSRYL